ncbi:uncharacterized protein EI97DRAFT_405208 [Westerdykella ornata]|uniref:GATA-type domain-containing protein n=1 Tax=Westerdykella ornata TaxID=318751 RepID=A0A6A6JA53_WESOR|nr:uncharacterized protein EI97DRAFT_405208 [Westerdykella ornata]KAF2273053.1 hypothetical protein EI97DRAFT_405208 [Westerdykella ornata]
MASHSGSGGISLAPTPTHPHIMSREPSKEDIELARNLSLLNNPQDQRTSRSEPMEQQHGQQKPAQEQGSEIYHSLEDAVPLEKGSQPEQHATPVSTATIAHRPATGAAGPFTQVCSNCGTTRTPLWRRSPTGETICNACGLYQKARNQARPVNMKRVAQPSPAVAPLPSPAPDHSDRSVSPAGQVGGSARGATYVAADQDSSGTCPGGGRCNGTGGQLCCNGCPAYNNRVSKTAQFGGVGEAHGHAASGRGATAATGTSVVPACQNCGTTVTPLWRRDEEGRTICNACGLYHKLHGRPRPVLMKKQEIKRRKRVAPAGPEHASPPTTPAAGHPAPAWSQQPVSPAPSSVLPSREHPAESQAIRAPPAIDFTNFYKNASAAPVPQGPPTPPSGPQGVSRKRSLSVVEGNEASEPSPAPAHHRPHDISSLLNPARPQDSNIDPALSSMDGRPRASPVSMDEKLARKEKLRREAEAMREELARKERELLELEG